MPKITMCTTAIVVLFALSGFSQSPVTILAEDLGVDALVSELLSSKELQEAVDLDDSSALMSVIAFAEQSHTV